MRIIVRHLTAYVVARTAYHCMQKQKLFKFIYPTSNIITDIKIRQTSCVLPYFQQRMVYIERSAVARSFTINQYCGLLFLQKELSIVN